MANRRSVLIGLGGLVAGGGALLGTGAFTTVTAERTVNVETAGDADAFLGLAPADRDDASGTQNEYVANPGDGTLEITLENTDEETSGNATGLNQNAITVFRNLVTVTNNGTQEVTSLNLEFIELESDSFSGDLDKVFSFTVLEDGDRTTVDNGNDILTGKDDIPDGLGPGSTINFGLKIDLLEDSSGVTEIPADSSFTLQITAETSNSA